MKNERSLKNIKKKVNRFRGMYKPSDYHRSVILKKTKRKTKKKIKYGKKESKKSLLIFRITEACE